MRMVVHAHARTAGVEQEVVRLGPHVGETACLECEGTGWWAYAEPEIPGEDCVSCKGTGKVLIGL